MILTEQRGTVLTSGDIQTSQFRIKASRKAFEILSAGLYSDKVRAIIRELSTNAADAHVAAGKKDVAFDVHLPNNLEPWFAVKDFGTGLSDKAMLHVYTTYFESDKTGSNDFTGALGLGSKSPFSYTDSFTVESRHEGVKRVYNAYLSEDGLPSIARMTEEPSDEPNGLTVKFPVRSGDFNEFRTKAEETLRWFKVRPTVSGWHQFAYTNRDYLLKTDDFAVVKTRAYGERSFVVMGNVAYPITTHDFLTGYDDDTNKLKALVEWGVELYVGIGEVDIAASREKLGFDKRTIRTLKDKLRAALETLGKHVTADIAGKPTLWEARKALHQVRSGFKGFQFTAEWGGKEVTDFVRVTTKQVTAPNEDGTGTKTVNRPVAEVERLKVKSNNGDRVVVKRDHSDTVYADGTVIFINDERGGYAGVRRYLGDKSFDTQVYLISNYDEEWLASSGIGEVAIKTSTLPKAVRVKGERGSSVKAKLYEFVPGGNSDNGSSASGGYWQPAEVEIDDGGVYVEILYFNYRMKEGEGTTFPGDLNRPLGLLKTLGKDVKLYGIRPSDKAMLDKSEGEWINLREYALEVLKEKEQDLHPDFLKAKEMDAVNGGSYYRQNRIPFGDFKDEKFTPTSEFGRFIARMLDANRAQQSKEVKAYAELRQWAGLHLPDDVSFSALSEAQEAIWTSYPMLRYVDPYRGGNEYVKDATAYVNMVDAA